MEQGSRTDEKTPGGKPKKLDKKQHQDLPTATKKINNCSFYSTTDSEISYGILNFLTIFSTIASFVVHRNAIRMYYFQENIIEILVSKLKSSSQNIKINPCLSWYCWNSRVFCSSNVQRRSHGSLNNAVNDEHYSYQCRLQNVSGIWRLTPVKSITTSKNLCSIKYKNYIGNGDSKTFKSLSEKKLYGDSFALKKFRHHRSSPTYFQKTYFCNLNCWKSSNLTE